MRKRLLLLSAVLVVFLTSCGKLPDMRELLAYQKEPLTMALRITDEEIFHASVTLGSDVITLTLNENTKAEEISFSRCEDGALWVSFDGLTHKLPAGNLSKASVWLAIFTLSPDGLWKIKRDTMGGIAVFVCTETETAVTVYIDAATLLPLKITQGALSVDVTSVSR